tara:strand:+ start:220 stop:486 length:267 start_codon:yes stop_codon:yes gene_type:complete
LYITEGYELSELEDYKIMTKKRFSAAVESIVVTKRLTYIDAITHLVEERMMDYGNVKRLLSDSIKQKLEVEASELRLIKTVAGNKLPL